DFSDPTVYTTTSSTQLSPGFNGVLQSSHLLATNTAGFTGNVAQLQYSVANGSAHVQNAYIDAVSTSSAWTPAIVIGQQTGGTASAEYMRLHPNGKLAIGNRWPKEIFDLKPSTVAEEVCEPFGAAAGNTGEVRFEELAANGTTYVGFKAPDSITASKIWTLP